MNARVAGALAVAAVLLAGCTQTVSGRAVSGAASGGPGTPAPSTPAPSTSAPSSSSPTPSAPHLACPNVVDPVSKLAYECVGHGLERGSTAPPWPVRFEKQVDVDWTMDEGSGRLVGANPADAARTITQVMTTRSYGPAPTVKKEKDVAIKVGGAKAHLVQTLITLNPGYRHAQHLKVKQERLWIVAVQIARDVITGWYASIPDVKRQLWPSVPDVIRGMRVVS